MTERINEVGYCGIYCPNCGVRCRLPKEASALRATMKAGDWEDFGPGIEGFTPFWKFLNGLADTSTAQNCREGNCGHPGCGIRICAREKGVAACPMCADFPCDMINTFSQSEPTLVFDGLRMKEISIGKWIDEQEARRQNGFSYDDIRCGKSNIPLRETRE